MDRELAVAVASCPTSEITGLWHRHAGARWPPLTGDDSGGRWGLPGAFPMLSLHDRESVVVAHAYLHLVESGVPARFVQPRHFITCSVSCSNILDVRAPETLEALGLEDADVRSRFDRVGSCQRVGGVAHQIGLHGILSPSECGLGETLTLFERNLPAAEIPVLHGDISVWSSLPQDPRQLRVVRSEDRI